MEDKNRSQKGLFRLSDDGDSSQANRARNRTMVVDGGRSHQIRSDLKALREAKASGDVEARRRIEDSLLDAFPGGEKDEPEEADSFQAVEPYEDPYVDLNVQEEQPSESATAMEALDDVFDLPLEAMLPPTNESEVVAQAEDSDPFDFQEDVVGASEPEPPKAAAVSVGRIVRPSAFVAPTPVQHEEVPAVSEVPVPVKETFESREPKKEAAMTSSHEQIFWKSEGRLIGFLISFDHNPNGSYVELRPGRLIISCNKEASGSCLLIPDASVSPMHAIMRVSEGSVLQVLDQLSEAGTRIRRANGEGEEFLSGDKANASHGDIIFFGERKFHVCLLGVDEA